MNLLCEPCAKSYGYYKGRWVYDGRGWCYECLDNIEDKPAYHYSEKDCAKDK